MHSSVLQFLWLFLVAVQAKQDAHERPRYVRRGSPSSLLQETQIERATLSAHRPCRVPRPRRSFALVHTTGHGGLSI